MRDGGGGAHIHDAGDEDNDEIFDNGGIQNGDGSHNDGIRH